MITSKGYMPVLLTKAGERQALADLSAAARAAITPLFVVEPVAWDFDNSAPLKSNSEHLDGKALAIAQSWLLGPAAIDLRFIDDTPVGTGQHPLVWITAEANALGLPLTPVVGTQSTPAYQAAAAQVAARDGRGACIRLTLAEWPSIAGTAPLTGLLAVLGLGPGDCDLVLDLGEEAPGSLALVATTSELTSLLDRDLWRSLVVAGAGLPKSLSELAAAASPHLVDRSEWLLYQHLIAGPYPHRVPAFGDYAIAHPDPEVDVNPRFMNISASFRYTAADHWIVGKGALFKGPPGRSVGGEAIRPVAADICAHRLFTAGHCGTEAWLAAAAGTGPTGNPTTWRRQATRHHLERVVVQLATLHGP